MAWLIATVSLFYWLYGLLAVLRSESAMPRLSDEPIPERKWPKVSLLVPACDEEAELEAATRSKLDDGYPDLELVLVDDRSRDRTGEIVDRLAADPRVQPVHVRELPAGWLGKLHALARAEERASGEWLIFTDADVRFEKDTVKKTIALCERLELDHLSAMPSLLSVEPLVDAATVGFVRVVLMGARAWSVPDPRSKAFAGVGAFNVVRRSVWKQTQGFEWLKLEVGDDMAVGMMIKRATGLSRFVNGMRQLSLVAYPSVRAFFRGAEKGVLAFRFSAPLTLVAALLVALVELGAWWALGAAPSALALAGVATSVVGHRLAARLLGIEGIASWLPPVASVILFASTVRSGVMLARFGGVRWRNTVYPARLLRDGQRLTFR